MILSMIEDLHTGTTSRVRLGAAMSDSFLTSSGVRQGCILAPALFCRAIDWILERDITVIMESRRNGPQLSSRHDDDGIVSWTFPVEFLATHTKMTVSVHGSDWLASDRIFSIVIVKKIRSEPAASSCVTAWNRSREIIIVTVVTYCMLIFIFCSCRCKHKIWRPTEKVMNNLQNNLRFCSK